MPKGFAGDGETKGFAVWPDGVAKGFTVSTVVGTMVTGGVIAILDEVVLGGAVDIWKNIKDPPNPATIISRNKVTIMNGNFLGGGSGVIAIVTSGGEFIGGVGGRDEIEAVWKGETGGVADCEVSAVAGDKLAVTVGISAD